MHNQSVNTIRFSSFCLIPGLRALFILSHNNALNLMGIRIQDELVIYYIAGKK